MKKYEVMYIVEPMEDDAFKCVVDKFNNLISANGGEVIKTNIWGKKRLAYMIQDFEEGLYLLVEFKANIGCIKELDRVMRITDEVLRHMIISKGE